MLRVLQHVCISIPGCSILECIMKPNGLFSTHFVTQSTSGTQGVRGRGRGRVVSPLYILIWDYFQPMQNLNYFQHSNPDSTKSNKFLFLTRGYLGLLSAASNNMSTNTLLVIKCYEVFILCLCIFQRVSLHVWFIFFNEVIHVQLKLLFVAAV